MTQDQLAPFVPALPILADYDRRIARATIYTPFGALAEAEIAMIRRSVARDHTVTEADLARWIAATEGLRPPVEPVLL